nr:DUF2066 domain-containing protein [Gammaproteobacteria bacterium]
MRPLSTIGAFLGALLLGSWLLVPAARAVTFADLYEAEVPVESQAAEQRTEAVQRALSTVLVRVTGRREVAADETLSGLVDNAERYVQQFGYTADEKLRVGFDGTALRSALLDAGQPVWG